MDKFQHIEHIGSQFVKFDVYAGVSPVIEVILPPGEDPEVWATTFQKALLRAVDQTFQGFPHRLTMDKNFAVSVLHSRVIKTKEEEAKDDEESMRIIGE